MKIDPDGYKLAVIFSGCAFFLGGGYFLVRWQALLWMVMLFCLLAAFTLFFFRDPQRTGPEDEDAAVSAADGVVIDVSPVEAEGFNRNEAVRIAVFMNMFNVHVNRNPLAGTVTGKHHRAGKKLPAFNKRAEYENEHGDTDLKTPFGNVRVRQIAGIIARRVVTRVKEGDVLKRGDRLGIIRFGSRVDVFLPKIFEPVVSKGARVRAGETIIARLTIPESKGEYTRRKEYP